MPAYELEEESMFFNLFPSTITKPFYIFTYQHILLPNATMRLCILCIWIGYKKQNVKSTQVIVESPKFCKAILTIHSNLIIFGLH